MSKKKWFKCRCMVEPGAGPAVSKFSFKSCMAKATGCEEPGSLPVQALGWSGGLHPDRHCGTVSINNDLKLSASIFKYCRGNTFKKEDILELGVSLPKDMRDDFEQHMSTMDFTAVKLTESCVCMTYVSYFWYIEIKLAVFRTLPNNLSNINWLHVYLKTSGVMSCAWGKDCTTRVQHKVANRTTVGSCLHEKIAGVILTPSNLKL